MLKENQDALIHLKEQFTLTDEQFEQFTQYTLLLEQYNIHTNLVSKNDMVKLVSRHIYESLQILSLDYVKNAKSIMDVGSGGGFPGIPVAIMISDVYMNLVESRKKKAVFLQQVCDTLKLDNTRVFPERVEDLSLETVSGPLDVVMARAVASLSRLCEWCMPFLKKGGSLVTYKGIDIENELKEINQYKNINRMLVPGLDASEQRYFIQIIKD